MSARGIPPRSARDSIVNPCAAKSADTAAAWPAPISMQAMPPGASRPAELRREPAIGVEPVRAGIERARPAPSRATSGGSVAPASI